MGRSQEMGLTTLAPRRAFRTRRGSHGHDREFRQRNRRRFADQSAKVPSRERPSRHGATTLSPFLGADSAELLQPRIFCDAMCINAQRAGCRRWTGVVDKELPVRIIEIAEICRVQPGRPRRIVGFVFAKAARSDKSGLATIAVHCEPQAKVSGHFRKRSLLSGYRLRSALYCPESARIFLAKRSSNLSTYCGLTANVSSTPFATSVRARTCAWR